MKLFLQKKCKIFERWGLRPQTPQTAPQLRISGYAPGSTNAIRIYFEFFSTTNQHEYFEHVQNIRDGLPNQPECSTNVTNALRINPNALRIMIRTTFGLIWAQCD